MPTWVGDSTARRRGRSSDDRLLRNCPIVLVVQAPVRPALAATGGTAPIDVLVSDRHTRSRSQRNACTSLQVVDGQAAVMTAVQSGCWAIPLRPLQRLLALSALLSRKEADVDEDDPVVPVPAKDARGARTSTHSGLARRVSPGLGQPALATLELGPGAEKSSSSHGDVSE